MTDLEAQEIAAIAAEFDRDYYLARYGDVAAAGVDPVWHYCAIGWRERRDPTSEFDTSHYLQNHPDIAAADINPFWHYLVAGRTEGRLPKQDMAPLRQQLKNAWANVLPLPGTDHQHLLGEPRELEALEVLSCLKLDSTSKPVVISVSHDDYAVSFGGIQNIIGDECKEFQKRGVAYLHLCPAKPLLKLAPQAPADSFEFAVRLNGEAVGRISGAALRRLLVQFKQDATPLAWVVHHLMGHLPELLRDLIAIWTPIRPIFWAHDYFADCSSYALMRNNATFCGAPPPESGACRVCAHGDGRAVHRQRIAALIQTISPDIVAPSQAAADLWCRGTGMHELPVHVIPPARLLLSRQSRSPRVGQVLRVAFVGATVFHKGWSAFEGLANAFKNDERYQFFQFGSPGAVPRSIRHIDVRVSSEDRDAMVRALATHDIDVVISWSLWPETFCFTAHEALAAGAFLVYRRNQGHVDTAAKLNSPHGSYAVDDEAGLNAVFRTGVILKKYEEAVMSCGCLLPSIGTAELLEIGTLQGKA